METKFNDWIYLFQICNDLKFVHPLFIMTLNTKSTGIVITLGFQSATACHSQLFLVVSDGRWSKLLADVSQTFCQTAVQLTILNLQTAAHCFELKRPTILGNDSIQTFSLESPALVMKRFFFLSYADITSHYSLAQAPLLIYIAAYIVTVKPVYIIKI